MWKLQGSAKHTYLYANSRCERNEFADVRDIEYSGVLDASGQVEESRHAHKIGCEEIKRQLNSFHSEYCIAGDICGAEIWHNI